MAQKARPVKVKWPWAGVAGGSLAIGFFLVSGQLAAPSVAATPPPPPPPLGTPATPSPNATLFPIGGSQTSPSPAPGKPTPTPPPGARKGVEGVWEVQIQHPSGTDYTHFAINQQGDALNGTYVDKMGKKYPLAGTLDGQAMRLVVSMPNGTTILLEGKLDGTTDMIGTLTAPGGVAYFTASYRPKEKWIENVNPGPGGMGGVPGGGGGGGGYTPP